MCYLLPLFMPTAQKPRQRFCVFSLSCFKCYWLDCYGTYFTHAQTCDNVRVPSVGTCLWYRSSWQRCTRNCADSAQTEMMKKQRRCTPCYCELQQTIAFLFQTHRLWQNMPKRDLGRNNPTYCWTCRLLHWNMNSNNLTKTKHACYCWWSNTYALNYLPPP